MSLTDRRRGRAASGGLGCGGGTGRGTPWMLSRVALQARAGSAAGAAAASCAASRVCRRTSQRDGTVGLPWASFSARESTTSGAQAAWHEIVRGEAETALDRRQAELGAHGPVQPGAGVDRARPAALVQAAEQHEVGVLQARLQLAPDRQPRMPWRARPHRTRRHQLGEQGRIGRRDDRPGRRPERQQLRAEAPPPPRPPRGSTARLRGPCASRARLSANAR